MALLRRFRGFLWSQCEVGGWPGMDRPLFSLSSDRLGFRSTKFPFFLFFLPHALFLAGMTLALPLLVLASLAGLRPPGEAWMAALVCLPCGLGMGLLVPIIIGQRSTLIDRRRRFVREARGVSLPLTPILPLATRRHPLESFNEVRLAQEVRLAGKRSYQLLCVYLGGGSISPVLVVECCGLARARRLAERCAAFLRLPLVDRTVAPALRRDPDTLDRPLHEGPPAARAVAPPGSRMSLSEPDVLPWTASLSRPALDLTWPLRFLVFGALAALVGWFLFPVLDVPVPPPPLVEAPSPSWSPWPRRLALAFNGLRGGLLGLGVVTAALGMLGGAYRVLSRPAGWRLTVDASGLEIRRHGSLPSLPRRIPAKELEELRVLEESKIRLLAVSDRKIVTAADGIDVREANILREAVIRALQSASPPSTC